MVTREAKNKIRRLLVSMEGKETPLLGYYEALEGEVDNISESLENSRKSNNSDLDAFKKSVEKSIEDIRTIVNRPVEKIEPFDHEKEYKKIKKEFDDIIEGLQSEISKVSKIRPNVWGGSSRTLYLEGGTMSPFNLYSDINFIPGTGISMSAKNNDETLQADVTITSTGSSGPTLPLSLPNGGWGITNTRTADTSSGTLNDHVLSSVWTEFTTNSNSITLTGIAAMPDGTEIILTKNTATGLGFTLLYSSTLSIAANRFILPQQEDLVMKNQSSVRLRYDGSVSRWRFLEGVTPSNSNGPVQFASTDGSAFADDGSNFIYSTSLHRLQLTNLEVNTSSLFLGDTLIQTTQMVNDGVIPFTHTSSHGAGTIGGDLNLFWDNLNKRLGLGTQSPAYQLDVVGNILTLPAPNPFNVVLQSENLTSPPSDSLGLFYGPLDVSSGFTSLNLAGSGYNTSTTITINYTVYTYRHDALGNTWTSPSGTVITFNFPYSLNTSSDNGSVENPGYSGYNNNDTVSAVVYGYNNTLGGGILYTSAGIALPTINLANNPSGIDWIWTPETLADGNPVSGYIIEITDQTTSTTYSYDVGTSNNYADMNAGGTVSYTPFSSASIGYDVGVNWTSGTNGDGSSVDGYLLEVFDTSANYFDLGNTSGYEDLNVIGLPTSPYATFASQGGFTSGGQSFSYDIFIVGISPSGGNYFNDNGNGFNITITESLNNGTLFWVQHNIGSTGGNSWRELENDGAGSGGQDGTGDIFIYQVTGFTGTTTTTPNHYGIQSDGSTLNRDYEAYTQDTSPSTYYSSLSINNSIFDPNNGQYYYISYSYSTTGTNVKALEQINSGGYNDSSTSSGSSGTFYQDALGGVFTGDTVVTPTSISQAAGRFQNAVLLSPVALQSPPINGALEYDGVHLYFTIGSTRHTII